MKISESSTKEDVILDVALNLFVNQGFHGTPTSQIARQAGVSNGTLFHYFKTKEDLINRLYLNIKLKMMEVIGMDLDKAHSVQGKLKIIWKNILGWYMGHQEAAHFIQQFTYSPYLTKITKDNIEDQKKIFEDILQKGKEEGVIKNIEDELIYVIIMSFINGYLLYAKNVSDSNYKKEDEAFSLLWDAIKQ